MLLAKTYDESMYLDSS